MLFWHVWQHETFFTPCLLTPLKFLNFVDKAENPERHQVTKLSPSSQRGIKQQGVGSTYLSGTIAS